jgi:hypothetical protein
MLAETETLPWMLDAFAASGYAGRTEEINFGSRVALAAEAGAGAVTAGTAGAEPIVGKAAGGGAGGFEVRPLDVSNPAGGTAPDVPVDAISVIGALPSP